MSFPVLSIINCPVPIVIVGVPAVLCKARVCVVLFKLKVPLLVKNVLPNWLLASVLNVAPLLIVGNPVPIALTLAVLFKINVPARTVVVPV